MIVFPRKNNLRNAHAPSETRFRSDSEQFSESNRAVLRIVDFPDRYFENYGLAI
jgi:hypothetical protein